jgi:tetratricopeptide (TPR) repeat protein
MEEIIEPQVTEDPQVTEVTKKKKNIVYKDIVRQKGELSDKAIKQLCAETGRTEASIRGEIQVRGIDRKGDITISRYKLITVLRKKGWKLRKICADQDLCSLFYKPEGKTVSINTVRKYLSKDFKLSEHVDFSKDSTYSVYQRGKETDDIQSFSYDQDELLEHILLLHVKANRYDCDLTYSKGNFYKTIPKPIWRFDKFPKKNKKGESPLPLDDVDKYVEQGTLHSVVVDLPFIVKKLPEGKEDTAKITRRFDRFDSKEELVAANESIIATASRLLHDDGFLIMKTQDSNSSGNQIWTHTLVEQIAEKNGLLIKDLFLCINADDNGEARFMALDEMCVQRHARKVHTYFYVFKKVDREELGKKYDKAIDELEQHNTDEAIKQLTAIARYGYDHAMLRLGEIYYWGQGIDTDTYQAIYWLKKAAEKGSLGAIFRLGQIYYNMPPSEENTRKALEYYNKAYLLHPKYALYTGIMYLDGRFSVDSGNLHHIEEGLTYVEEAFNSGKMLAGLYAWKMLRMLGRDEEAEDYYAIEQLLRFPYQLNQWARALCEWGEYEKALPYIERCIDIAGKYDHLSPTFLDTYAEILYGLGRLDEAKEAFNRCLEMYTEKDERRSVYETKEKIRKKFAQ